MPTRVKSITGHQRHPLMSGWELCSAVPGAYDHPEALRRAPTAWLPARAPSTAAECLQAAELWSLDAPPRRFDSDDWWYRVTFPRPQHQPHERLVLGFDGLATLADVWLNGEPLFSSSNMFVAHECALDERLAAANELVICFRALDRALEVKRPRPKWRTPMVESQQLRWFRTTLLGRAPGWSPPAAPVGPWRPVWLETRAHVSLTDLSLRTGVRGDAGWLEVECKVVGLGGAQIARVELSVARDTHAQETQLHARRAGDPDGAHTYGGRLEIPKAVLWWPHTHGEPALYDARLTLRLHGSSEALVADLGRVGFRTLTLHTREGDFALHVNGVPIFCRGACWTPLDPVGMTASQDMLRAALGQVRSAGMNMLRIGGMMVYESDDFLDLCDASGILLWQDFMFANMSSPEEDPAFAATVEQEARQQLARLAGRPCLAVLCGNSEGEQQAAMWGALRDSGAPQLFHSLLADPAPPSG